MVKELFLALIGVQKQADTPDPFKKEAEIRRNIQERKNWKPALDKLFVSKATKQNLGL